MIQVNVIYFHEHFYDKICYCLFSPLNSDMLVSIINYSVFISCKANKKVLIFFFCILIKKKNYISNIWL